MAKDFRIDKRKSPIVSLDIDSKTGKVGAKISKSKASLGQKRRWEQAKLKQKVYNNLTGENLGSKQFFKNKNVLDENLTRYELSSQANYKSA